MTRVTGKDAAARSGHLDAFGTGDVVVCSWAGWSSIVQLFENGERPCYVDLAANDQTMLRTDYFGILPNHEAGAQCVTQLLERFQGAEYQSVVLPVTVGGLEALRQ